MKFKKKPLRTAIVAVLVVMSVKVIEITPRRYYEIFGPNWIRRCGA
jgi:hypothetical protein